MGNQMIKKNSLIVTAFSLALSFWVAPAPAQDNNASRLVPIITFLLDEPDECPGATPGTTRTITDPIDTQAQLDELQGVARIDGDLVFNIPFRTNFDFSALASLVEVRGGVFFGGTVQESISGFNCLSLIETDLDIRSIAGLTSISGFDALTSVGRDLTIFNNLALVSVSGFGVLTEVGRDVSINFNNSLTSVPEFDALTSIGEDLNVISNRMLLSLPEFNALISVGESVRITSNSTITSISRFGTLTAVLDLLIDDNDALVSIQGFDALTAVRSRLLIENNDALSSIEGLSNLESSAVLGSINVRNNPLFDCSNPMPNFLPATTSTGNAVNCDVRLPL